MANFDKEAPFDRYNFDEPWDSPSNLEAAIDTPGPLNLPGGYRGRDPSLTSFHMPHSTTDVDCPLLVVECPSRLVVWTKPEDLTQQEFADEVASALKKQELLDLMAAYRNGEFRALSPEAAGQVASGVIPEP